MCRTQQTESLSNMHENPEGNTTPPDNSNTVDALAHITGDAAIGLNEWLGGAGTEPVQQTPAGRELGAARHVGRSGGGDGGKAGGQTPASKLGPPPQWVTNCLPTLRMAPCMARVGSDRAG